MTTETYTEPNINDEEACVFEDVQGSPSDSQDNKPYPALPPGLYISARRTLSFERKTSKDGTPYVSVKLTFEPLQDEEGTLIKQGLGNIWINTLPRRDGGLTSVAEYLKAFDVDARLLSGKALQEALQETQDKPVVVRTGLEDSYKDRAPGEKAKRDDFFKRSDGKYVSAVKDPDSGRTIKGWPIVYGFRKYTS